MIIPDVTFPFFQVWDNSTGSSCECCQAPAPFLAGNPKQPFVSLCETCLLPFTAQALKNKGADLRALEAGFCKLSEAVDEPPASPLVM